MPLTLEQAEQNLLEQAAEIKALKSQMELAKSGTELDALKKRLDEMTAKFDALHDKYAAQDKDVDEAHHCFWCA